MSHSITVCVVSSPSEVGLGCEESVSDWRVSTRGGMRHGEWADLREKGENPVEAFTVFIMSNQTFGKAFTQPVWFLST